MFIKYSSRLHLNDIINRNKINLLFFNYFLGEFLSFIKWIKYLRIYIWWLFQEDNGNKLLFSHFCDNNNVCLSVLYFHSMFLLVSCGEKTCKHNTKFRQTIKNIFLMINTFWSWSVINTKYVIYNCISILCDYSHASHIIATIICEMMTL